MDSRQSAIVSFGIIFDFDSNNSAFLLENKIYLFISFPPIEDFISSDKSVTDNVCSYCRFENMSPCLAIAYSFCEREIAVNIFQCIVVYLEFWSAGSPA